MREASVYERAGGMETFLKLGRAFYGRVAADPVLRPLYPESLEEPAEHLALFIAQYFGGPRTYSERRGQPRLRLRHLPFAIGRRERDVWVGHMLAALAATVADEEVRAEMAAYFEATATFLINQPEGDDVPVRAAGR
jgi:hemoglobin